MRSLPEIIEANRLAEEKERRHAIEDAYLRGKYGDGVDEVRESLQELVEKDNK